MLNLTSDAEHHLFRLVNKYGVETGCKAFQKQHTEKKVPTVLLEAYFRRLKRLSKMTNIKSRRPDGAHLVTQEKTEIELERADEKLRQIAEKAKESKLKITSRLDDIVNRTRMVSFAQAYLNDKEAGCQNVCFKYFNQSLKDWLKELFPLITLVAREKARSKMRDMTEGGMSVDHETIYRALQMNGNPLTVSEEAAAACEQLPVNAKKSAVPDTPF